MFFTEGNPNPNPNPIKKQIKDFKSQIGLKKRW